jgi:hypothetical protein
VLIKRRTDLWNAVSVAVAASQSGQCIVVGVAKGSPDKSQRKGSKQLMMEVTIPLTLIELPSVHHEEEWRTVMDFGIPTPDEDSRWEATLMRLLDSPLGRSAEHYGLEFDGFEEINDEEYVIRQTTFKTRLIIKPTEVVLPPPLYVAGVITPGINGRYDANVALYNDKPEWTNGAHPEHPSYIHIFHQLGTWEIFAADNSYAATVFSDASSPVGLTGWTVITGTGQPTLQLEPDAM